MPRLFKRILLLVVVLCGVATGVIMAFGDRLAGTLARHAVARLTKLAATRGIELGEVRFARASFAGFGAIRCDELAGTVVVSRPSASEARRTGFTFLAGQVVVDAGWPWSDHASLVVVDGEVGMLDAGGAATSERIARIQVRAEFPFSWGNPTAAAGALETEARRLGREGTTGLPLEFRAVASFTVGGRLRELPVHTEAVAGGGARIALERADVEVLAREYINPLTQTEIDLVLRHPQRAPTLLRLSEQAARAASEQHQRDHRFPHDAYRHVYWSWLLTREFGPEFSEEVTDAHEIGATYEFTAASRRMDLRNNAVGRAFALARVPESELVKRVLTDPNVVRDLVADALAAP